MFTKQSLCNWFFPSKGVIARPSLGWAEVRVQVKRGTNKFRLGKVQSAWTLLTHIIGYVDVFRPLSCNKRTNHFLDGSNGAWIDAVLVKQFNAISLDNFMVSCQVKFVFTVTIGLSLEMLVMDDWNGSWPTANIAWFCFWKIDINGLETSFVFVF